MATPQSEGVGTFDAGQAKSASPDSYPLMMSSLSPFVVEQQLIRAIPYDALDDFDLLTIAVQAPKVRVVPAVSPLKTAANVIAAACCATARGTGSGHPCWLGACRVWVGCRPSRPTADRHPDLSL